MKRLTLCLVMSFAFVAFLAPSAFSDTIAFTGNTLINGTGIGNTINVLSLQGTPDESGSISPLLGTQGDAKPSSNLWTSAQLSGFGLSATNFGIVFNPNETGPNDTDHVFVQSFILNFYNAAGALQFSAPLVSSAGFTMPGAEIVPISTGTGSSGYLIAYTGTNLSTFFLNPDWIVGASGAITGTDDGPDNFYLVNLQNPTAPIPEPGTMMLLGSGLIGLAGWGRKKFRK